jgi:Family of unknown function (DUF6010)
MHTQIIPDFTFANFTLASLLVPIFITLMSLLKEPLRQKINAGLIAVAGGAYINAGLMPFDQLFNVLLVFIAYKGLQNYKFIALGWILHTCWDIVHHFYGNPIDPTMPDSTNVCAFFDPQIAMWFYFGAPSIFDLLRKKLSKQAVIMVFMTFSFTFSAKSQIVSTRDSLVKAYEQSSIMLQGNKYSINGTSYKMGFGNRNIGETLKKNPMAYAEFELFKKNQKKGLVLNLVGGGAALASILVNQKTDKALFTGLSVVGLGCLGFSIPFTSKSTKHFNKAVWLYNRDVLKN